MKQLALGVMVALLVGVVSVHADIARPPNPNQPLPKQPLVPPLPQQHPQQPGVPPQPLFPQQPLLPPPLFPPQPLFPQQPVFPPQPLFPQQPARPQGNPVALGSHNVEIVVEVDPQAATPRLQIPINLLGAGGVRRQADAGHIPTLMTGLALTCAFVSGGFWLVRKGRSRLLVGVLLGLAILVGGASVWADLGFRPPPRKEAPVPLALPATLTLPSKFVLEVVPAGTKIKLIATKDMLPLVEKEKP